VKVGPRFQGHNISLLKRLIYVQKIGACVRRSAMPPNIGAQFPWKFPENLLAPVKLKLIGIMTLTLSSAP